MRAQSPKLQAAENDLRELMADVTRAMEKAQEAVARLAAKAAAEEAGAVASVSAVPSRMTSAG
jgi:hypothetical protein